MKDNGSESNKSNKMDSENEQKILRIWQHITFSEIWENCDTSKIDDIAPSWFRRRQQLQDNSTQFKDFIDRLKREHAIETGIVEKLYDLKRGVTEIFIKEGFVASYLSHDDTNIPTQTLMNLLNDQLDAVDFVFDVVNNNRPLTTGFINELHALVTHHQPTAKGVDIFGNRVEIPLRRGAYKQRENNPTREDGTVILYCPPEHTAAEMDNLVKIYDGLVEKKIHPVIIAAWFHHLFTTIHPFQDGNGRVARLLASLIFIKNGYFPFTVLREERNEYIRALELADQAQPQELVDYFGRIQRRNIEKVLNLRTVTSTSFSEVADIFSERLMGWRKREQGQVKKQLAANRMKVFEFCREFLDEAKNELEQRIAGNATISIGSSSPNDTSKQHYYTYQIVSYAKKHDYFFNRSLPRAYLAFRIELSESKKYQLVVTIHHYGYDDTTIAIGAFLEFKGEQEDDRDPILPLDIKPYVFSIDQNIAVRKQNITSYLRDVLTFTLAQIADEIN